MKLWLRAGRIVADLQISRLSAPPRKEVLNAAPLHL